MINMPKRTRLKRKRQKEMTQAELNEIYRRTTEKLIKLAKERQKKKG